MQRLLEQRFVNRREKRTNGSLGKLLGVKSKPGFDCETSEVLVKLADIEEALRGFVFMAMQVSMFLH